MNFNLIIDFDSTFVKVEVLDELANLALEGTSQRDGILMEVRKTTALGMEGQIPFDESLRRRLGLLGICRHHVDAMVQGIKTQVSASIEKNKGFFRRNGGNIYIISGGFKEIIAPLAAEFGIPGENIFANTFVFDGEGKVTGVDAKSPLSGEGGKVKQIRSLNLEGTVLVIGDGYTDFEIKKEGLADKFVFFAENVSRPPVSALADYSVSSFDDFLEKEGLGEKAVA